jgi:hypothetical protein
MTASKRISAAHHCGAGRFFEELCRQRCQLTLVLFLLSSTFGFSPSSGSCAANQKCPAPLLPRQEENIRILGSVFLPARLKGKKHNPKSHKVV